MASKKTNGNKGQTKGVTTNPAAAAAKGTGGEVPVKGAKKGGKGGGKKK